MLQLLNSFRFFLPFPPRLPGFWNALIYVRPRYLRYRRKQKEEAERELRIAESELRARQNAFTQRRTALLQALSAEADVNENTRDSQEALDDDMCDNEDDDYVVEIGGEKHQPSPVKGYCPSKETSAETIEKNLEEVRADVGSKNKP